MQETSYKSVNMNMFGFCISWTSFGLCRPDLSKQPIVSGFHRKGKPKLFHMSPHSSLPASLLNKEVTRHFVKEAILGENPVRQGRIL